MIANLCSYFYKGNISGGGTQGAPISRPPSHTVTQGGGLPLYGSHKSNGQQKLLGSQHRKRLLSREASDASEAAPLHNKHHTHMPATQGHVSLLGITEEENQVNQESINDSHIHDVMVGFYCHLFTDA